MTLKDIVSQSDHIVFFGGAGVSTESGIPDFRSEDGLYRQKYDVSPEIMLSADYFDSHTEEFYRFYKEKMLSLWANRTRRICALPNGSGKENFPPSSRRILTDFIKLREARRFMSYTAAFTETVV